MIANEKNARSRDFRIYAVFTALFIALSTVTAAASAAGNPGGGFAEIKGVVRNEAGNPIADA
ncbi:hypothetical protein OFM15_33960, partial [Escherichia coli]|nr:hypothetical protein [Escherichia coli]